MSIPTFYDLRKSNKKKKHNFSSEIVIFTAVKNCSILHRCIHMMKTEVHLGQFFFYFLVYGSSDPNFCILKKKKNYF